MSEIGEKRGPGAPYGNANASRVPWPDGMPADVKMESVEDLLRMQQRVIEWLATGQINARAAGSINNSLKTLLGYHANAAKIREIDTLLPRIKAIIERDDKEAAKP